jgi:hypothetical protein
VQVSARRKDLPPLLDASAQIRSISAIRNSAGVVAAPSSVQSKARATGVSHLRKYACKSSLNFANEMKIVRKNEKGGFTMESALHFCI